MKTNRGVKANQQKQEAEIHLSLFPVWIWTLICFLWACPSELQEPPLPVWLWPQKRQKTQLPEMNGLKFETEKGTEVRRNSVPDLLRRRFSSCRGRRSRWVFGKMSVSSVPDTEIHKTRCIYTTRQGSNIQYLQGRQNQSKQVAQPQSVQWGWFILQVSQVTKNAQFVICDLHCPLCALSVSALPILYIACHVHCLSYA